MVKGLLKKKLQKMEAARATVNLLNALRDNMQKRMSGDQAKPATTTLVERPRLKAQILRNLLQLIANRNQ